MRAPPKSPPPNAPPLALSVGEVARRSGVPVSTVHFYQAKGLIAGWRSSGNQRRFPRGVLRRIAFIRVAQRAGVPLSQIRSALSTLPAGRAPSQEDWRRLSSQWRGEVEERIRRLTQLRDRFDDCIGCGCLSLKVCPLRNPDDRLAREGTGPRLLERRQTR
jgi:MerR family transcriptional regulator, redox-sensitive transcriptional activator SoxR